MIEDIYKNMRTFAKKNELFWRSLDGITTMKRKGFLLVSVSKHPMVTICDASFGKED